MRTRESAGASSLKAPSGGGGGGGSRPGGAYNQVLHFWFPPDHSVEAD